LGISIYGQLILVPFSSNVSWRQAIPNDVRVLAPHASGVCHIARSSFIAAKGEEEGWRAGFTVRKFLYEASRNTYIHHEAVCFAM